MAIQNISNLAIEDSFQGLVQHDTASKAIGTALGAIISEIAVTASFATTASYAINSAPQVSASYATSASIAAFAVQAGIADSAGFATSAGTALSASFSEGARNATSASFATNARTADSSISSSYSLVAGIADSATSASFSEDARTADSATTAVSSSYALIAASVQGTIESASFAENARTADSATSASYALVTDTAVSASHAEFASTALNADSASVAARATTLSADATASYADLAGDARNADSASNALRAISASIADDIKKGINVAFNSGSFNLITAVSASFGSVRTITGSAVILGEEYIILNADSPTLRYAGVKVYDSGSTGTGSFEWDSVDDNWFQVDTAGQSAGMLTGVKGNIGSELYPSANTLLKGSGTHIIQDSIITDSGTLISVSGDLTANVITANTNFAGNLVGNADTATTASHALTAVSSDTAISSSYALVAGSATSASFAQNSAVAVSASFAEDSRNSDTATTALTANSATSASFAQDARIATSASFAEDSRTATSASFASTVSRTLVQNLTIDGAANGTIDNLAIVSNTASLDLSNGNFFTLTLQSGVDTHLIATNIQAGQNVNLQITNNPTIAGTLSFDTNDFKFAGGTPFEVTATADAIDLMSFVTFGTSNLIGTGLQNIS